MLLFSPHFSAHTYRMRGVRVDWQAGEEPRFLGLNKIVRETKRAN